MAATAKGYPYPVGTDRVMDGDNAIQALAEKVDTAAGVFASGTVSITIVTANASVQVAVTYPAGRFTVVPVVVANAINTGTPQNFAVSTTGGTTSGTNVAGNRLNGSTGAFQAAWIACQN